MKLLNLLALAASAKLASAHSTVMAAWLNDVDLGLGNSASGYIRSPPNNSPITDVASPDMSCNVNGGTAVARTIEVEAGDEVRTRLVIQISSKTNLNSSRSNGTTTTARAPTTSLTCHTRVQSWFTLPPQPQVRQALAGSRLLKMGMTANGLSNVLSPTAVNTPSLFPTLLLVNTCFAPKLLLYMKATALVAPSCTWSACRFRSHHPGAQLFLPVLLSLVPTVPKIQEFCLICTMASPHTLFLAPLFGMVRQVVIQLHRPPLLPQVLLLHSQLLRQLVNRQPLLQLRKVQPPRLRPPVPVLPSGLNVEVLDSPVRRHARAASFAPSSTPTILSASN